MASSSRLAGRLLSLPVIRINHSHNVIPPLRTRAAAYATSAASAETIEELSSAALPDPASIKRKEEKKPAQQLRARITHPRKPSAPRTFSRRRTKSEVAEERMANGKYPPDLTSPFPHLPKEQDWRMALGVSTDNIQHRQFVTNPESIEKIVQKLDLKGRSEAAGRKLTVLECYPGPGTLTRRLLQDENVEKVIAMENHVGFRPWLQSLSTDPTLGTDASKLQVIDNDSFNWETYTEVIESGALDHIPAVAELRVRPSDGRLRFGEDWKAASPIILVGQFSTTVLAEQLLAQFTAAIARRHWMFRYARMPMFFVCSEHVAWRCTALPGHRLRSRMSVLAQTLADAAILLESDHFAPHEDHFWPYKNSAGSRLPKTVNVELKGGVVTGTLSQYGRCLLAMEPRADQLMQGSDVDAFEYVLRNLFVRRASTVKSNLGHLAPGAMNLLEVMKKGHPALEGLGNVDIDPSTITSMLTHTQFVALGKMFERWPFKPRIYFDNIKASPEELAELRDSLEDPRAHPEPYQA